MRQVRYASLYNLKPAFIFPYLRQNGYGARLIRSPSGFFFQQARGRKRSVAIALGLRASRKASAVGLGDVSDRQVLSSPATRPSTPSTDATQSAPNKSRSPRHVCCRSRERPRPHPLCHFSDTGARPGRTDSGAMFLLQVALPPLLLPFHSSAPMSLNSKEMKRTAGQVHLK